MCASHTAAETTLETSFCWCFIVTANRCPVSSHLCLGANPIPGLPRGNRVTVTCLISSSVPEQELHPPNQIEWSLQLPGEPPGALQAGRRSRAPFPCGLSAGGVPWCLYLEIEHLSFKNRINDIFVQHGKTMVWEHSVPSLANSPQSLSFPDIRKQFTMFLRIASAGTMQRA